MNPNKRTLIVKAGDTRTLVASINYQKLQAQDMITWKKKVYSEDEVKEKPLRLLFVIEDNGEPHSFGKELSTNYKFTKQDVGKYIKFYSYCKEFNALAQCIVFYVEGEHDTDVDITGVERVDSDSTEFYVGEGIELKVNFSISESRVSSKTKEYVKWMVKINGEKERLILDGLVITGSEIEFVIPEEWANKEVALMPYIHTEDVSIKANVIEYIPECGGTFVKPIGKGKYEVLDVFLGRDKSNRIFYLDKTRKIVTIGYSVTPYSFYNADAGTNSAVKGAIIDINDNSGRRFLNEDIIGLAADKKLGQKSGVKPLSLWFYILNAKGGEKYDFKVTNGTNKQMYEEIEDKYRGMPINVYPALDKPVYCSARDIGNIAAGMVAGMHGLSWLEGRVGFDGLESWQKKKLAFEAKGTQYAQRFGYLFGYNVIWQKRRATGLKGLPSYGNIRPEDVKEEVKILVEGDLFIIEN